MHNILINGGEHIDRIAYATEYAQTLLCLNKGPTFCQNCDNCQRISRRIHPNILWISPSTNEQQEESSSIFDGDAAGTIKIDHIRRIHTEMYKAPFEEGAAIFIFTHMHKATTQAANALLKIIEENQPSKVFLACAPSRTSVLPTIASRLINQRIMPKSLHEWHLDSHISDTIYAISTTAPKDRFDMIATLGSDRESILGSLHKIAYTCHILLRTQLIYPQLALGILESVTKACQALKKNHNPRLVLEFLLLNQWPQSDSCGKN